MVNVCNAEIFYANSIDMIYILVWIFSLICCPFGCYCNSWNLGKLNWLLFCATQERALAEAENRPAPPQCSSNDVRPLKYSDFKRAHEQVNVVAISIPFSLAYNFCCCCVQSKTVGNMSCCLFRFVRVYHRTRIIWTSSSNGTTSTEKADRGRRHRWATSCSLRIEMICTYSRKQPRR